MQVNAIQAELNSLHKAYNNCLKSRVNDWMAMEPAQRSDTIGRGENEFCVDEKKRYINYMEHATPIEFKNIMRLEEGNF